MTDDSKSTYPLDMPEPNDPPQPATESPLPVSETPQPVAAEPRRNFLSKALAVVIGGIVTLVPFAAGLAVFTDPLRTRKKGSGNGDDDGFIKVATFDELPVGNPPQRFQVIDDRVDAWNMFPNESVGTVYLSRVTEDEVLALNVTCPHVGCPVDYDTARHVFQCPCHNSSFKPTGEIDNEDSPAARGMDALEIKIKNKNEVWVKYQEFRPGTAEKIAEA
ncbi:Rieske (2Fe-2S) protein [Symmachiella dynata]|uniref:QcrA and Rieske domain-containing protein n=1 Tax=Symmachiella dynata TaxID=2527995 RepID=UPI0030EF111D